MNYYNWQALHKQGWQTRTPKINKGIAEQLQQLAANWNEQQVKQAELWLSQNPWCSEAQFKKLIALANHYK
jgi:hypothetical protein